MRPSKEDTFDEVFISIPFIACALMVLALIWDAFVVKPW